MIETPHVFKLMHTRRADLCPAWRIKERIVSGIWQRFLARRKAILRLGIPGPAALAAPRAGPAMAKDGGSGTARRAGASAGAGGAAAPPRLGGGPGGGHGHGGGRGRPAAARAARVRGGVLAILPGARGLRRRAVLRHGRCGGRRGG